MKAVLVIDKSESCADCLLNIDGLCAGTREPIHSIGCPLKPLPTKKKPDNPDESWEEMHERWGYNKCIEEIEE